MNVIVGRNNAGKSNILATIELVVQHLRTGSIATHIRSPRPREEYFQRDLDQPFKLEVVFDLSPEVAGELRDRVVSEAPHLERSADQISGCNAVSVTVEGAKGGPPFFQYLSRLAVGQLDAEGKLASGELQLLAVGQPAAAELFGKQQATSDLASDLKVIRELLRRPEAYQFLFEPRRGTTDLRYYLPSMIEARPRAELLRSLESAQRASKTADDFARALEPLDAELQQQIAAVESRETQTALTAFAGEAHTTPAYATWLMQHFGKREYLHLRETKPQIGREEARLLLQLKVRRGGPEKLVLVQQTVRDLLGVRIDAFEPESPERPGQAEMDIDDFLAEANGAGIREALRLILDIELKKPILVLIEEPEVHLHPGLEHAIRRYLAAKSRECQILITTHSTGFIDSPSSQAIYLVSRSAGGTEVTRVGDEDSLVSIPAELGLRLSSVFMHERLVFVEGRSDEDVLRRLAPRLNADLGAANVGFVQMGGIRNFAYYAADRTLDVLARRQIQLFFVCDRDERDAEEVQSMAVRLGGKAQLRVLDRRELENYLLDPEAIRALAEQKAAGSGRPIEVPTVEMIRQALDEVADGLKTEVIRLLVERRLLAPLPLCSRTRPGTVDQRLEGAAQEIESRRSSLSDVRREVTEKVEQDWDSKKLWIVPGSLLLDGVLRKWGLRFDKDRGDSVLLAGFLPENAIPPELATLVREIAE